MPATKSKKILSAKKRDELLQTLEERFNNNMSRHKSVKWSAVLSKIKAKSTKLSSLADMEATGGEPDVVVLDKKFSGITFIDCAAESPMERRSLCYDRAALNSRKQHKPKNSACDMANAMGIELLREDQYRTLQTLGEFDLKTSSWLATPKHIRNLGGAIFGDRRFDTVFVYHNGAESYYSGRGFRGLLEI